MASTLVFAMTKEGMKAFEVPCGARLDLTPPIGTDQFEDWNITGNVQRMKELLTNMTVKNIKGLFVQMGADQDDIPKKMKKEGLIGRFVERFEASRKCFLEVLPALHAVSTAASSSSEEDNRFTVVENLHDGMSHDEVIAEIRRQVPALADASRETVENYLSRATRIEVDGQSSHPTDAQPQSTKPFTGQGYKLGDDAAKDETTHDDFKDGFADFAKYHIKPDLEVRMLNEDAPSKENYTVDTSGRNFYEVELTEETTDTVGKLIVKLECQKCQFHFVYHYGVRDTMRDILELLEGNTNIKREQMVLFYKNGNSYFMEWEPIHASLAKFGGGQELRLCIRALGGAREQPKATKKANLTKKEKLEQAQKGAQAVASHDASTLSCLRDLDKSMRQFSETVATNPNAAVEQLMHSMSEGDLEKAIAALHTKGGSDYKMKLFARALFAEPMKQTMSLHEITSSAIEACELMVSIAVEKSQGTNMPFTTSGLRGLVSAHLNRRIGAREEAAKHMRD